MKTLQATALVSFLLCSLSAHAAQPVINVTVSGEISPGVYGEVQFGNAPPPPVVYAQPRIIVRQPPNIVVEPLYLHVPPGHAKKWSRYCRQYDACDRPVYFVKSREYELGYNGHGNKKHKDEDRKGGHGGEGHGNHGEKD